MYKQQLNKKWSSSSTGDSSVQSQQTLSSTGRGAGKLYLPVSIRSEWPLILSLVYGTLKYGCRVKYSSLLKFSLITCMLLISLLSSSIRHTNSECTDLLDVVPVLQEVHLGPPWKDESTHGKPALVRIFWIQFTHSRDSAFARAYASLTKIRILQSVVTLSQYLIWEIFPMIIKGVLPCSP